MLEKIIILIYFIICMYLFRKIKKLAKEDSILQCLNIIDVFGIYNLLVTLINAFLFFTKNNYQYNLFDNNYILAFAIINIILSLGYAVYYNKKIYRYEKKYDIETYGFEWLIVYFWFITMPILYIKLKFIDKKKSN